MTDPVLVQRARMARLAEFGQRIGYGFFGVAVIAFAYGMIAGFGSAVAVIVVAALGLGSVTLAPAIVLGYAVKAAAREDRERAARDAAVRGGAAPSGPTGGAEHD